MNARDEAHRIAWSKMNHDREPDGCVTALRRLLDDYVRLEGEIADMMATWIDPQRIVELAKRYTDEGKTGWVSVTFFDHDPTYGPQWQIMLPGNQHSDHHTFNEALKEAEA